LRRRVVAARSGNIIGGIQSVFPDQQPVDRTFINAWQDARLVNAVKKAGRTKLVIAGLWTEVCVAMPAIQAQGEGYDVYVVADASGGVSVEAHAMAMDRMIQSGVKPITWLAVLCEWQRDWAARQDKQAELTGILIEHGGSSGAACVVAGVGVALIGFTAGCELCCLALSIRLSPEPVATRLVKLVASVKTMIAIANPHVRRSSKSPVFLTPIRLLAPEPPN